MLETSAVTGTLDPEGAHLAALRRLADFRGARVLEMGCGDGRLTAGLAEEANQVVAFDPDAEAVEKARVALPDELAESVSFLVASAEQLEIAPGSFDLVVFSWSL
jgi:ubiquinone/menaquinone biosynthesis C-methylase UbiE